MKRYVILLFLLFAGVLSAFCQSNSGELRLHVADPSGHDIQATIHLLSQANQYATDLETDAAGPVAGAERLGVVGYLGGPGQLEGVVHGHSLPGGGAVVSGGGR